MGRKTRDGRWLAAPIITRRISNGVLVFTPDCSREEADQLVLGLNNVAKENPQKNAQMIFPVVRPRHFFRRRAVPGIWRQPFRATPFQFPTANHALYEIGDELKFFAPTAPDKPWTTGSFGCVRTDGRQMHEGLDIRCLQRDRHGEPTDPVMATADGTVVYFSTRPALSNYGKYIVIRHVIEGIEIYSLYAHLSEIQPGLAVGKPVKAGEVIATMGRTSNTGETITKDRAHVHFELNVFVNEGFAGWYKKTFPGQRNDHGIWNGQNLNGLDRAKFCSPNTTPPQNSAC
jgi:murein DD-endopeptidase MepM/ murein hydrolase activator NlpD